MAQPKHRCIFMFCMLIVLTFSLFGCAKYKESALIGKTAAQIEEQHGEFDLTDVAFVTLDSSFHGFGCGYLLEASRVGFLGTHPAEYLFIVFDENGIAVACYEGYHCNGG